MNVFTISRWRQSSILSILISLIIAGSFVFFLFACFGAYWGNDDTGMSMIAHGYGLAAFGSPNIVFSNVIWGYLVREIPTIDGLYGYSIAMISVLVVSGAAVIYGLHQLRAGRWISLLVFALIFVRPVLFPQFTINAGLLAIGGVICWLLYVRKDNKEALLIGCLLAFLAYLIRGREFLFILIVAFPLLQWNILLRHRFAKIVFLVLIAAISIAALIDHQAYQSKEWTTFNDTSQQLTPLVDFGASGLLKQRPDILQRHGYSTNDMDLLGNWFFVDLNILNPKALKSMLAELGPLPTQANALSNGVAGIKFLWQKELIPLTLAALLLLIVRFSWAVLASWILCLAGFFTLGLLGRPGILHVYVPLTSLLIIAPLLFGRDSFWHRRVSVGILATAFICYAVQICSEANAEKVSSDQIRKDLTGFPTETVVNWAASFPIQVVYPFLGKDMLAMPYRLYSLGGLAQAPYTNTFVDQEYGHSVSSLLTQEKGVPIVASARYFELLAGYCSEHLHGSLHELFVRSYGEIVVSQRRCDVGKHITSTVLDTSP